MVSFLFAISSNGKNLIHIQASNSIKTVNCFYPFDEYVNIAIPKEIKSNGSNSYEIGFDLKLAKAIRLQINNELFDVFMEPNDTIYIEIQNFTNKIKSQHIKFNGVNGIGIHDFNFNIKRKEHMITSKIGFFFFSNHDASKEIILEKVKKEIDLHMVWVNQLLQENKITKKYAKHLKTEIRVLFLNDFARLTNVYYQDFSTDLSLQKKGRQLEDLLRKELKIDETIVNQSTFMVNYYNTKYKELSKNNPRIDANLLVFPDDFEFYFFSNAPNSLKKYLIGMLLIRYSQLFGMGSDYCDLFVNYIEIFNHKEIIDYMALKCN